MPESPQPQPSSPPSPPLRSLFSDLDDDEEFTLSSVGILTRCKNGQCLDCSSLFNWILLPTQIESNEGFLLHLLLFVLAFESSVPKAVKGGDNFDLELIAVESSGMIDDGLTRALRSLYDHVLRNRAKLSSVSVIEPRYLEDLGLADLPMPSPDSQIWNALYNLSALRFRVVLK